MKQVWVQARDLDWEDIVQSQAIVTSWGVDVSHLVNFPYHVVGSDWCLIDLEDL